MMKSLRMSEGLLRIIANECEIRKLGFSDYMREAAIAAMRQQAVISETRLTNLSPSDPSDACSCSAPVRSTGFACRRLYSCTRR